MKTPDDVATMVRLKELGWGLKRIAAEPGCSRNTVRRWLAEGGRRPCGSPSRSKRLGGLSEWLSERFRRHAGNADVVRQELANEKGRCRQPADGRTGGRSAARGPLLWTAWTSTPVGNAETHINNQGVSSS